MPTWDAICANLDNYMVLKRDYAKGSIRDPRNMDYDTLVKFTMSIVAAQLQGRQLPFRFLDQSGGLY